MRTNGDCAGEGEASERVVLAGDENLSNILGISCDRLRGAGDASELPSLFAGAGEGDGVTETEPLSPKGG